MSSSPGETRGSSKKRGVVSGYGSLDASLGGSRETIFDGNASVGTDLGDFVIDENEELHISLGGTKYRGEIDLEGEYAVEGESDDDDEDDDYDDDDDEEEDEDARLSTITGRTDSSETSFHLGASTRMSARNIMVCERRTSSFLRHGDDYELVPTHIKNNVRMVEDINLINGSKGRLYLAEHSFFNNGQDLKFALTVPPNIYTNIMSEINSAFMTPCGLYFCCHGGDGAHTGVSHKDTVDIRLAWFFFAIVIVALLSIEFLVDDVDVDIEA